MECFANPTFDNCKGFTNIAYAVCPVDFIQIEDANKQIARDLFKIKTTFSSYGNY